MYQYTYENMIINSYNPIIEYEEEKDEKKLKGKIQGNIFQTFFVFDVFFIIIGCKTQCLMNQRTFPYPIFFPLFRSLLDLIVPKRQSFQPRNLLCFLHGTIDAVCGISFTMNIIVQSVHCTVVSYRASINHLISNLEKRKILNVTYKST